MIRMLRNRRSSRRGMSLIEASIVLGIAGLVIGSVWAVMSGVRNSSLATTVIQQTLMSVRNVRDYYGGRILPTGTAGETTAATFTGTLRAAGVFPEDMCPANCVSGSVTTIYNIYGGSVLVNIVNTSPYNTFNLRFNSVAKRGCVQTMMNISSRAAELGLVSITVGGGTARTSFPVTSTTADGDCASASSNAMDLVFNIRN